MQNNDYLKWIYLLVLSLIWGTSFILIKKALIGLNAYQLGAVRTIITGLFLFTAGYKKLKLIEKEQWKWIALSGFTGSFFPAFFFAFAETEIDSAVASILNSLVPLNTVLIGAAVFKIGTNFKQVLGIIIGFVGTSILILKGANLNPDQNYLYAGFVLLACIMYAINVNIIKRYLQDVKPLSVATGNYVVIFIPALIVLLFTGFFKAENFEQEPFINSIGYVVILSFFGTALAKVLYTKLVQMSTPVFASSVTYIMPIVALFWGILDGETFSWTQGLGSLIILLGVFLANRKPKKIRSN